jgi:hypothetical protein
LFGTIRRGLAAIDISVRGGMDNGREVLIFQGPRKGIGISDIRCDVDTSSGLPTQTYHVITRRLQSESQVSAELAAGAGYENRALMFQLLSFPESRRH